MTCSRMAIVAIRKIAEEYLTAAAGPTSHSPPPIDVAAITAPGPMIFLKRFRGPNGGGAGRSDTSHGGNSPWVAGKRISGRLAGHLARHALTISPHGRARGGAGRLGNGETFV